MKTFYDKVAGRLGKLDAQGMARQYRLLAREAGFFESVLGALAEGIIALSPDGSILYMNPAAESITLSDAAKARGKTLSKAIPDWDWQSLGALGTKDSGTWAKKAVREFEISYPSRRIVEAEALPGEHGTVILLRDVTAAREQSIDALESSRMEAVHELAAGVAHEIGNPLNAISLNLQLFSRSLARIEDRRLRESLEADAEAMRGEVLRLDGIVRKFLEALRPIKPELEPGSVAEPLKDMLGAMKPLFSTHSVHVMVDLPQALPTVMLDRAQLAQVFFNLAKNAVEAMKDGGTLKIDVSSDDRDVYLAFRDTGCGMDESVLRGLFSSCRTTKSNGNGLGLMLSQRICRAHGGTLDAASKPGEGTVFTVRIPRISRRVRELN